MGKRIMSKKKLDYSLGFTDLSGMDLNQAAQKWGIPKQTLQKRIDLYDLTLGEAVLLGRLNRPLISNPPVARWKQFNNFWLKQKLVATKQKKVYI